MIMKAKGMTLVEIVTAIAIFAIASVIILNGFALVTNALNESSGVSRTGSELARRLETDAGVSTSNGTINFTAGGKSFTINVQYKTASQNMGNGFTETRTKFGVRP
jgi:prepilin-type N-terminal cleavage/methylation domain-containing protein